MSTNHEDMIMKQHEEGLAMSEADKMEEVTAYAITNGNPSFSGLPPSVAYVLKAWIEPGSNPWHHLFMMTALRRDWPVLARALDRACAEQYAQDMEEERYWAAVAERKVVESDAGQRCNCNQICLSGENVD